MNLLHDKTLYAGICGTLGTLTLSDAHTLVGIVAGLATVAYMVTKTVLLITRRNSVSLERREDARQGRFPFDESR